MELVEIGEDVGCGYFLVETSPGSEGFQRSVGEGLLSALATRALKGAPFRFNVGRYSRQTELWDDRAAEASRESLYSVGHWLTEWAAEDFRLTPRRRLGGGEEVKGGGAGPNLLSALRAALDDVDVDAVWLFPASAPGQDSAQLLRQLRPRKVPVHVVFLAQQGRLSLPALGAYHLIARETGASFATAYFTQDGSLSQIIHGSPTHPSQPLALPHHFQDLKISLDSDKDTKVHDQLALFALGNPNWNSAGKVGSRELQLLNSYKGRAEPKNMLQLLAQTNGRAEGGDQGRFSEEQMAQIRSLFRRQYKEKERVVHKASKAKPYKELKVKTYKLEGLDSSSSSESDSSEVRLEKEARKVERLARKYLGTLGTKSSLGRGRLGSPASGGPGFGSSRGRAVETTSRFSSVRGRPQSRGSDGGKRSPWKPLGGGGGGVGGSMDRSSWMDPAANRRTVAEENFYRRQGKATVGTQHNGAAPLGGLRRPQVEGNRLVQSRSFQHASFDRPTRKAPMVKDSGTGTGYESEPEVVADQAESIRQLVSQNSQLLRTVLKDGQGHQSSAERDRIQRNRSKIFQKISAPSQRPTTWQPAEELKSAVNAQIRGLGAGGGGRAGGGGPLSRTRPALRRSQTELKEEQRERVEEAREQYTERQYKHKFQGLLSEVEARNAVSSAPSHQGRAAAAAAADESYVLTARSPKPQRHPARVPLDIIPN